MKKVYSLLVVLLLAMSIQAQNELRRKVVVESLLGKIPEQAFSPPIRLPNSGFIPATINFRPGILHQFQHAFRHPKINPAVLPPRVPDQRSLDRKSVV